MTLTNRFGLAANELELVFDRMDFKKLVGDEEYDRKRIITLAVKIAEQYSDIDGETLLCDECKEPHADLDEWICPQCREKKADEYARMKKDDADHS